MIKGPKPSWCPECHEEGVSTYYVDINGEIIGCEECIFPYDANLYEQERWQAAVEDMADAEVKERLLNR